MALKFMPRGGGSILLVRDEQTGNEARIDTFCAMHDEEKYYVVTLHDGTKMRFESLENAKAWVSIALRT